jgi:hypothetical protein
MQKAIRHIFAAALIAAGLPSLAENRVHAEADWSVFKAETGAKECWIVSAPTAWTAKRSGKDVTKEIKRGNVLLMISIRPGEKITNELSFSAGYPLGKDRANLKVGDAGFTFLTDGEWGWTRSADDDDKAVDALRKGAVAVVTGVSTRGTETTDTFSLRGFTAALARAQELCK